MKLIFLDRDGVINEYPGPTKYVNNHIEFNFIPGSVQGVSKLNACGFKLVVISNQAGVAKELYTLDDLEQINRKMISGLKENNACVSGIYYCTHHPQEGCSCRKPGLGLLKQAVSDLGVVPEESFFIGDSFLDMRAAKAFGAKSVLVLSGREKASSRSSWEFEPDFVFDNLLAAAEYICKHHG